MDPVLAYPSGRRCSRLPPAADASRRPSPPPPPGRSAAGLGERPPSGAARPRPQPPAAARPERGRGPAARLARGRRSRRAPFCGGLSASLYTFNQWKHSTFIYLYKMTVKSPQRSSSEGCQASSNTPFKGANYCKLWSFTIAEYPAYQDRARCWSSMVPLHRRKK